MVDPHAVATRHLDPITRTLAALAVLAAERPWALTAGDRAAAHVAGIDDAGILHAILQASLFGHLNRIADAVGVAADYPDRFGPPRVEPATPAYLRPPITASAAVAAGAPPAAITLALRAGTAERLAAWLAYAVERDGHLERRRRAVIRSAVAAALGDGSVEAAAPRDELDAALVELADVVTLAPWRLGPAAYARVRGLGLASDEAVFDAVATASSCTVASRIAVALAALARS